MKKIFFWFVIFSTVIFININIFSATKSGNKTKGESIIWPEDVYKEASEFAAKGDYQKAEEVYLKLIKDYPTVSLIPFVKYDLGVCYLLQKRIDEALKIFEELLKDNTNIKDLVYTSMADIYIERKNYDKALDCYQNADRSVIGGSDKASYGKANLYLVLKKYAEAEKEIRLFKGRFPKSDIIDEVDVLLLQIYIYKKDFINANMLIEEVYKKLEENPKGNFTIFKLAEALFDGGNFEQAIAYYNKVLSQDKVLEIVQRQMNIISEKVKNLEKSRAPKIEQTIAFAKKQEVEKKNLYEEVKAGKDLSPLSSYRIGQSYLNMKKFNEARKKYKEIMMLFPKDEIVKEAAYGMVLSYLLEGKFEDFKKDAHKFMSEYSEEALTDDIKLAMIDVFLKENKFNDIIIEYKKGTFKFKTKELQEEGLCKIGLAYYGLKDYMASSNIFEDITSKSSKSNTFALSLFYLGNSYYNLSKYDEAIKVYDKIINEYPKEEFTKDSIYQLGFSHARKGAYPKAVEILNMFLQKYPNDELSPDIFSSIGDIYVAQEKFKEAIETYEKVLKIYSKSKSAPRIHSQIGMCYFKQEKYDDMVRAYELLIRNYPQSEFCAEAFYWIGWKLIKEDKKDEGMNKFNEAKKWKDTDTGREIQFKIGEFYYSEKEFKNAEKEYLEVIKESSNLESIEGALERLRDIYEVTRRVEEGIKVFEDFSKKRAENKFVLVRIKMGIIHLYLKQKKVEAALGIWREISGATPKEYFTAVDYYTVGSYLEGLGKEKEALPLYLEIISRYPSDNAVPYAYSRASYIYLNSGRKSEEIYNFIKPALNRYKGIEDIPEISLVLAQYNFEKGNTEESMKYYKKSISKAKGKIGAESYFRLGTIFFKQNKYKEALTVYLQVAFVYNKYKDLAEESLFKAARCAELIGQREEAKKYYQEFVKQFPNSKYKKDAEAKLKELK
ncbi:MAG: tetratricopeptide repeat protein [Candidatus Firestonebacteria bacterium]